jgi:hypothetical protein
MKSMLISLVGTVAIVCAPAVNLAVSAQAKTPLDAYKAYLDAASKATSADAIYPFISKDFKSMLQGAPKAEVEKMIQLSIAKDKLTDITVVKQTVEANKAVLELKAKTGDGRSTTGKVTTESMLSQRIRSPL